MQRNAGKRVALQGSAVFFASTTTAVHSRQRTFCAGQQGKASAVEDNARRYKETSCKAMHASVPHCMICTSAAVRVQQTLHLVIIEHFDGEAPGVLHPAPFLHRSRTAQLRQCKQPKASNARHRTACSSHFMHETTGQAYI